METSAQNQRWDKTNLGRPLLILLTYNNGIRAKEAIERIPLHRPYDVLIHDDCSSDDTYRLVQSYPYPNIRSSANSGIGASLQRSYRWAIEKGYQVIAIAAGNAKDSPEEVERLFEPIYENGFDYVQGSRRLKGASSVSLPFFRKIFVPIHAFLFRLLTGIRTTDAINGFRAYRIKKLLADERIDIWQRWLSRYELETYLHYKVLSLNYRFIEVPVTKSYFSFNKGERYSHIRPWKDWWSILRPLFLVRLGIRQ